MTTLIGLLLLLGAATLILLGYLKFTEEKMDDVMRAAAPGQMTELSAGLTHYRLEGRENGTLYVLIHGLSTPSYVFEALMPAITERRHRVLTYDLYGRGFSDRPAGVHDLPFYRTQLFELLTRVGVQKKVVLVGYSMGGMIAADFAQTYPDRVQEMILIAPAGFDCNLGPFLTACASRPVLGDWLMLLFGGYFMRKNVEDTFGTSYVADIDARIKEETYIAGYLPAVLSAIRNTLSQRQDDTHKALCDQGLPVKALWGEADTVIPLSAKTAFETANPNATHVILPDAGHDLPYRNTPSVVTAIFGEEAGDDLKMHFE